MHAAHVFIAFYGGGYATSPRPVQTCARRVRSIALARGPRPALQYKAMLTFHQSKGFVLARGSVHIYPPILSNTEIALIKKKLFPFAKIPFRRSACCWSMPCNYKHKEIESCQLPLFYMHFKIMAQIVIDVQVFSQKNAMSGAGVGTLTMSDLYCDKFYDFIYVTWTGSCFIFSISDFITQLSVRI